MVSWLCGLTALAAEQRRLRREATLSWGDRGCQALARDMAVSDVGETESGRVWGEHWEPPGLRAQQLGVHILTLPLMLVKSLCASVSRAVQWGCTLPVSQVVGVHRECDPRALEGSVRVLSLELPAL